MAEPYNYAGILGQSQQLVPNILEQEIRQSLGQAQVQQAKAQTAHLNYETAKGLRETAEQERFGQEVQAALESGDMMQVSRLMARYPQFKDALKSSWDTMDQLQQRSEMRQAAGIWSALNAGNTDAAIKQLEARITSDRQAGQDTSDDEEQLALLKSGDPKAINSVKGRLGLFMASVVPDKFASVVEQLGTGNEGTRKGQVVGRAIGHYDENGNWVIDYRDPEAFTLSEGQTRFEGSGGAPPSGGFDSFYEGFLKPTEGGYIASDGKSGAPANFGVNQAANPDIDVSRLSPAQAKQIMHERYWKPSGADQISDPRLQAVHADTAVNMGVGAARQLLQQSGGDPARYLSLREARYREIGGPDLRGWLNRNNNLARYVGVTATGARPVASVAKSADNQYRILGPSEVQAMGLDPELRYQISPNGQVTLVGGQDIKTRKGRVVPDSTAKRIETNVSIRDGLMRAVDGFRNDYAGNTVTGGLENTLQGVFGTGSPGQRDWWADFRSLDNQIRNDLFGAALTAPEKKAYEATTISERMKPAQVRKNLQRRLQIVKGALARQQNFLKKNGYETEAVDALFATDALDGQDVAPVRVRSVQEAMKLAPGTVFITPDGRRKVR